MRTFGQEPRHKAEFASLNEANRYANMTTVNLNAAYFPAVELMGALATVAVVLYGGNQAIQGEVSIGVLVAFVAALNGFFDPIQQLSQVYTTYQSGMAASIPFELLAVEADLVDNPDAIELPRVRGALEFRDVSFRYGDGAYALQDISLSVPPGETIALVGPTGAGKTTLAARGRFYDPSERDVVVDGHDLRDVTHLVAARADRGRAAGAHPVQRNDPREHRVRPAGGDRWGGRRGRAVGADELISALPGGYDTPVGERGVPLSVGQRQLIAFARALLPTRGSSSSTRRRPASTRATRPTSRAGHPWGQARSHHHHDRAPPVDDGVTRTASS